MNYRNAKEMVIAGELMQIGARTSLIAKLCPSMTKHTIRSVMKEKMGYCSTTGRNTSTLKWFVQRKNRFIHAMILHSINKRVRASRQNLLVAEQFLKTYKAYLDVARLIGDTDDQDLLDPSHASFVLDKIQTGLIHERTCETCSLPYLTLHDSTETQCQSCSKYSLFSCRDCHEPLPKESIDSKTGKPRVRCDACNTLRRRDFRKKAKKNNRKKNVVDTDDYSISFNINY